MDDARTEFVSAIRATLGFSPDAAAIVPGRFIRFPTRERGRDDAGYAKLFDDQRGGVFGDMRTGVAESWNAHGKTEMTRAERIELARSIETEKKIRDTQQRVEWAINRSRIERLWTETASIERGDPVARYLASRGLDLWPLPACLRLHRGLPYFDSGDKIGVFPAMIAPLVTIDGRVVTLHRTYLTGDGCKAPVPKPKKLMAASGLLRGAAIPLDRHKVGVIGIAEGVETALAARSASGIPTVAAYCAANLAAWHWPTDTRRIVIFGDNDAPGRDAAARLMQRATAARISVEIMTPTEAGADWCDVWSQREPANTEGIAA